MRSLIFYIATCILFLNSANAEVSLYATEADKSSKSYSDMSAFIDSISDSTDKNVVVTLGPAALKNFFESNNKDIHVIAIYITQSEYNAIVASVDHIGQITAIYIDPSIDSLLILAKQIYGTKSRFIIPYSDFKPEVNFSRHPDISIRFMQIKESKNWLSSISDADAIIAIPDKSIFTSSTITPISLSLYRRGIGLVGYSKSMTAVGAVASLYIDGTDLKQQLSDQIKSLENGKVESKGSHLEKYKVSINITLSKTLGLYTVDEKETEKEVNRIISSLMSDDS
jgi:hypothetical protein